MSLSTTPVSTIMTSAAGIIRYPLPRFLLLLLFAAAVQSLLFLQLGTFIGQRILPYLNDTRTRVALIAVVVLAGALIHHVTTRRRKAGARAPESGG